MESVMKTNKLSFSVREEFDHNDKPIQTGVFSRDWESEELSDEIMDGVEAGALDAEEAMEELEEIIEQDPENLETYNALCSLYWENELKPVASEFYEKAYKLASALIPRGFKGQIPWSNLDNRAFLRVAYGRLLCLIEEENGRAAQALANKLLRWSPMDSLGVRLLMGDIKLIQFDYAGAMKHYLKYADEQPVHWYQAALIAFRDNDFVSACTYLRRGIAHNPYVAEGILGRTVFFDHLYWHSTTFGTTEAAVEYLQSWPRLWSDEEVNFVDWVFNHSSVLRERSEITKILEDSSNERDAKERDALWYKKQSFLSNIDSTLSEKMVRPIMNRWQEEILPWDRLGHMMPAAARNEPVH